MKRCNVPGVLYKFLKEKKNHLNFTQFLLGENKSKALLTIGSHSQEQQPVKEIIAGIIDKFLSQIQI